jgi:hypothetical protein
MKKLLKPNLSSTQWDPQPIPVGEVIEDDPESTWAMWEDSVAFQDSQMGSYTPTTPMPLQPESENTGTEPNVEMIDPFATVKPRSA